MSKPPNVDDLITERAETITALRREFRARGLDVAAYSDDAVSEAMRADVDSERNPNKRLALAFRRLASRST